MALHTRTPLIFSKWLSDIAKRNVFMKMEAFQPTGCFKLRGIGLLGERAFSEGKRLFISSSGGNAGVAVAYAAKQLGAEALVVVPKSTPGLAHNVMRELGATVEVRGEVWDEADAHAHELQQKHGDEAQYFSPFDDPTLWEGHASLVHELQQDMEEEPAAVVLSVGGGGLLCGVAEGLEAIGWEPTLVAAETNGAHSLKLSVDAGELRSLPSITSLATSLGALRVAPRALEVAQTHKTHCVTLSDVEAVEAVARVWKEESVWVEPACGAAVHAVNEVPKLDLPPGDVVLVLCGGRIVNRNLLGYWARTLKMDLDF